MGPLTFWCVLDGLSVMRKIHGLQLDQEKGTMSASLPAIVAAYFDLCNKKDVARLASCFAPDATVRDEGHVYRGHDAIVEWKTESQKKFEYSVEPLSVSHDREQVIVAAKVVGNFPGSPVELDHVFLLADDKIKSLEIH